MIELAGLEIGIERTGANGRRHLALDDVDFFFRKLCRDVGRQARSFARARSGGVRAIQSVMLNVPNSEKRPSSKTSRKWHSCGPSPWIE